MPKESDSRSYCWQLRARSDEVDGLLKKTREQAPGLIVQVFGSDGTPNPRAVEMVASQTLAAARSGFTLAERPELDLLLRLAGTRQIGEALRRAGYKSGGRRLFMVAASQGPDGELQRLRRRLAKEGRIVALRKRTLGKEDLDKVERAALLAARL